MADFNGHLVELDRREDKNGQMLRQLAEDLELEILNLREECEGKHTWMVRDKTTCIDYALASKRLSNRLQKIVVDDNGELSVGSNHSTILLHFGAIQRPRSRPKRALTFRLSEGDIEAVCQDFDESEQRMNAATYEEYATELRQAIAKRSVARSAQEKRRLVPWWDAEIGRAIRYRQDANREHRQALKSFGKGLETLQLWEEYQRRKALTQAIVEEKKQAHDCKEMADIQKGGKKAGEKFWRYIGSLDRKDSSPQLVDPDNGSEVKNIKALLGEYLYTLFGTEQMNCNQEGMKDEIPHLEDAPQSTTADQNATVVGRVQVERALARPNGSTAQGVDGISAKVLKGLGPDAREHLALLFSRICCGDDPIPSDWRRGRVSFILKTFGNKQLLHDYRPLTVTPVAYRVIATIINGRITQWAEESGILTELQNGFRLEKGLRQGCPLSATLYVFYASSMERALEKTAIGFSLTHLQHGEVITWRLPGLAYADDLVLIADSVGDMRKLLATCETEADQLQLRFNAHNCDQYLVTGELWKAVAVPGLTFGNSVIGIPSALREYLERRQRDVGRQALGCHGKVANELVEGDVEWSSFEAREASSKLEYYARLRHMVEDRWHGDASSIFTSRRSIRRGGIFGAFCMSDEPQAEKDWVRKVRTQIKAVERERWTLGMQQHTSLHLYASFKTEIAPITSCRNTLGSRLLIEARGGALRTRQYCRKFDGSVTDMTCSACGEAEQTTEHLLLTCQRLLPAPIGDSRIEQALGFTNEHDNVACSRQTGGVVESATVICAPRSQRRLPSAHQGSSTTDGGS
ncbi:hypothetical protein HPB47_015827 [Ixodes persulcatus]|uniref:Uncharacterized protein n=1 Tax=Ixodes persulcatus TaxID=34615 RepID=A0AC60QSG0_IXOPE|nr:hypothetical protein HPB47_015827 [Ixodes persulcatus]